MILYELTRQREEHPTYQALHISNLERQYGFLQSIVSAALEIKQPFLSQTVIKAMNFHAIACLHTNAGEFRPCQVDVGEFRPPDHYRVNDLMDEFVNYVNWIWERTDAVWLAAYVLWRLNNIHPFINGNGRTARAACYFVLCVKAGGWLPGSVILPELLHDNRDRYIDALREADQTYESSEQDLDLTKLHTLISELLQQQLEGN